MSIHWILRALLMAVTVIGLARGAGAVEPGPVDKDAPEEFTKTPTGLKYRLRRKSDGDKPGPANSVKVHYKGWLTTAPSSTAPTNGANQSASD